MKEIEKQEQQAIAWLRELTAYERDLTIIGPETACKMLRSWEEMGLEDIPEIFYKSIHWLHAPWNIYIVG